MKKQFTGKIVKVTSLTLIALFLEVHAVCAQLKVGQNPESISAGSVLEIESQTKGVLLPRVSLSSTTTWGLDGSAIAGMQVFNNNVAIAAGVSFYPTAPGGIGMYYWDGTGWVPNKTPVSGVGGDFDWLKSSNSGNPTDPTDISESIFHGGADGQEVSVLTTSLAGAQARMSVRAGHGSASPIIGNFFAQNDPLGGRVTGLQTISSDALVFRTTFSPEFAPDERMRIASYGTVGIHTRFPSKDIALQVNGPIVQTDFAENESDAKSGVRMEKGSLTLFNSEGSVFNGSLIFKDKASDLHDAKIFYSGNEGIKSALTVQVSSAGGNGANVNALTILSDKGFVGFANTNPQYRLDVAGEINATGEVRSKGVALTSDARLKRNILPFQNGLEVVSKLMPVSYEKKATIAGNDYSKSEIGFIAQDIQKILPQLVREGKDADKILALDYNSLIPILTRAIQEQQKQIDALSGVSAELAEIKIMLRTGKLDSNVDASK